MQNLMQVLSENVNNNEKFDVNRVVNLVLLIRKTKRESDVARYKHKIFILCAKLILKAINNFFKLTQSLPPHKILHTKEDIVSECYIIISTCIDKVDLTQIRKFYYYLNSGLNRGMYRIYEKQYMKLKDTINDENEIVLKNKGYDHHFDLLTIDLKCLNADELKVIKMYLKHRTGINVYLKKKGIDFESFYAHFENAKYKIKNLYGFQYSDT